MLDVDLKQKLLFICTADKISYVINISFLKKKILPTRSVALPASGLATLGHCDILNTL